MNEDYYLSTHEMSRLLNEEDDFFNGVEDGDKDHHKVYEAIKVGYKEAVPYDSVNVQRLGCRKRRGRVGKNISNTLQTSDTMAVVEPNMRIRRLTPLECWRLQGFTDEQFYKAKDTGMSNSQLYKQAGNAVTVNVVDYIVRELFNEEEVG